MERRILGRTSISVSVLGFGAANIAYLNCPPSHVERLIGVALDAGINVIDTAECYPGGEAAIGLAVDHRRAECLLFTKCGHAGGLAFPDWEPRLMELQIGRSLKLLRTDYVDLLSLHSCPREVLCRGDVIEVLVRAREAGKTRYIGYSGDGDAALLSLQSGNFDVLQTSVSIADQEAVELTLPLARELSIGVIAKRPIANAAWRNEPFDEHGREYRRRLDLLQYDFLEQDQEDSVTSALCFTMSIPGVSTAIVGTTNVQHLIANIKRVESCSKNEPEIETIRARWKQVAKPTWTGLR